MLDLEADSLFLYFGDDYVVNVQISCHQPTIGEIVDYGEGQYFSMIHSLTAIPSDSKAMLWDQLGIDWNKLDDFEFFMLLSQNLTPEHTGIIFGDLDFSKLKPYQNPQNDEVVLADKEAGIIIDKLVYMRIMSFLRKLHNITPKPEKAKGKSTKYDKL